MDLALYDSEFGYYARAAQRSGRAGDFFTSVDVGALFGELLAVQIAEMAGILHSESLVPNCFDLVEAGCGNGRLSADILTAARERDPKLYDRTRLHLVELSADARAAQRATLGDAAEQLATSSPALPPSFEGVVVANELLDAMPVHQVVMREEGLREIYVDVETGACGRATLRRFESLRVVPSQVQGRQAQGRPEPSRRTSGGSLEPQRGSGAPRQEERSPREEECWLTAREGPLSTPALADYLARLDVSLEPGWRVEINLRALDWIREAARRLRRGFIILIDYGHEARELYSGSHSAGTLTTFARHTAAGPESTGSSAPWLHDPGAQDMTAHVDFTSVRAAAEAAGLETLGFLDQTYFLMGLVDPERMVSTTSLKRRLALKTLLMPGGLGSTMKVLILGKGVGTPALRGCSYRMRVT
jgi:SAM-dependent MidA family methyltransferase